MAGRRRNASLLGKVIKFTFASPKGRRRASERMWVLVIKDPDDDYIIGRLIDEPVADLGIHEGDVLFLSLEHGGEVRSAPAGLNQALGPAPRGRPKTPTTLFQG